MGINVLSLFDGISCGQVALQRAGIDIDRYYASEIDKHAIKITQKNYPNTTHIGDVRSCVGNDFHNIDLLMGGSPCQGFSISGNQLNFNDKRSALFFEFVRLHRQVNAQYFLFENVGSMQNTIRDAISLELKTSPVSINSSLLSAQHRNRLYWTNIPNVIVPRDKGILFPDILEDAVDKKHYYSDKVLSRLDLVNIKRAGKAGYKYSGVECDKCPPIVARHYKGMQSQYYPVIRESDGYRKLTPIECERLQTLPDNYTEGISDTQRYKCIGNAWTVDVISHIMDGLRQELLYRR